jgi:hypothetical protein
MGINLYRVSKLTWTVLVVPADRAGEPENFDTIEQAAERLEAAGVQDLEIDKALIIMEASGHTRAMFTPDTGMLKLTDEAKPVMGIA